MQTYEGADDERTIDQDFDGDRYFAYCCSNSYTITHAEGATRR